MSRAWQIPTDRRAIGLNDQKTRIGHATRIVRIPLELADFSVDLFALGRIPRSSDYEDEDKLVRKLGRISNAD